MSYLMIVMGILSGCPKAEDPMTEKKMSALATLEMDRETIETATFATG